jgi:glyoxylase-like metal-dependent hydrolase (beta-lactamase superfamily II)
VGAVKIAGTVEGGEGVPGFRVHHFPGHAPGQIGLFRESDRLALCSDTVYLIDSTRLKAPPTRRSERRSPGRELGPRRCTRVGAKLAVLQPAKVCTGHSMPLKGQGIDAALAKAAGKY